MYKNIYEKIYKTQVEAEDDYENFNHTFANQMSDIYEDDDGSYKYAWRQIRTAPLLTKEQSARQELSDALDGVE